jgi:hypothetical protein
MKDTITLSCMGWVTHFFLLIFYENKKIVANSIFALFFLYIIYIIKSYIVMAFLPAILLWGVGLLSYKIKDTRLILFARYFLYASAIGGIALVGGKLENEMFGEYNVESVALNPLLQEITYIEFLMNRMVQDISLVILIRL